MRMTRLLEGDKMLLAIDIGNSDITLGLFTGSQIVVRWRLGTDFHRRIDEYAASLLSLLTHRKIATDQIDGAVIGSVVPALTPVFDELCRSYFAIEPLIVRADVKTEARILLDYPFAVGADRIANAVGGHHLYSGPLIIIDAGTALTFDVVSKEGDYVGGAIAPGITIGAKALTSRTAMLPQVELIRPPQAIGRNTVAAIQSGILFGYAGLVEGIVARIQNELADKAKVIATGGEAYLLAAATTVIDVVNRNLTLIGMRVIYEMNRKA
ncbi:type III pantothenate kinase [Candidatus Acetothermia bacterium]|nr:type III pantothenate kinase [Candidatus Acetothermia bacterium]